MRAGSLLLLLACGACAQAAPPTVLDTFADVRADPRFAAADLVVVGSVRATRETGEETMFPGTLYRAAGLASGIVVDTVVKGDPKTDRVLLHHYRLDVNYVVVGGPRLLHFDPRAPVRQVFFLKKEDGPCYAPAQGQTDSADSVTWLRGEAP